MMPHTNRYIRLNLYVGNNGNALIDIGNEIEKSVKFQYVLKSVTPESGSFGGGTELFLQGAGFDSDTLKVFLGMKECQIREKNYFNITCVTPATPVVGNNQAVQVFLCNLEIEFFGGCRNKDSFQFQYHTSKTPNITDVHPRIISEPNTIIYCTR